MPQGLTRFADLFQAIVKSACVVASRAVGHLTHYSAQASSVCSELGPMLGSELDHLVERNSFQVRSHEVQVDGNYLGCGWCWGRDLQKLDEGCLYPGAVGCGRKLKSEARPTLAQDLGQQHEEQIAHERVWWDRCAIL
jgi:hypothetical protein